ncbi:hypothetical protein [Okeania sp. SIO2B3]|uniref:hypothetical protein n=1 Tax=Okeania sp. SIO2B3 TaxID=2607784 RepID=UPI0013C0EAC7|nr:hypothetical protein [Okeania sp. SIO2B3]NET45714.1 hypothetical protein [Okeania sp. SIO2B3]
MNHNNVPRMFRAQIEGRCQIQRLPHAKEDAYEWADQWVEGASSGVPRFNHAIQWKDYKISWRFVTNSGQDEGVIRPVIGAKGHPYYPGASMKGAFLRNCTPEQAMRYCGGQIGNETKPGILRFHGGYPQDGSWTDKQLVDIVHPQQECQVEKQANHSAFVQISLYQPTLVFGLSSNQNLDETEWEEIWLLWEQALGKGIGSRVSAGYGHLKSHKENLLFPPIFFKGKGLAPKLINETGEFRPNMFKAALRGHTLRLFGGVTNEVTAQKLTKKLWGGFNGKSPYVGKLGIAFNAVGLEMDTFGHFELPTYELNEGKLEILCLGNMTEQQHGNLKKLMLNIVKFSLLLGGFGKSWRRIDHRLFFSEYFRHNNKPMIGCHWEFTDRSKKLYIPVHNLSDVTKFLDSLHSKIKAYVQTVEKQKLVSKGSDWREAWHPEKVEVWGRIAEGDFDSEAIYWFHQEYQRGKTIQNSVLTGQMGRIGRIWHRMYPRYIVQNKAHKKTREYVELLTIFPDDSENTNDFIDYLKNASEFEKVW